jgi:hypothetical protein
MNYIFGVKVEKGEAEKKDLYVNTTQIGIH